MVKRTKNGIYYRMGRFCIFRFARLLMMESPVERQFHRKGAIIEFVFRFLHFVGKILFRSGWGIDDLEISFERRNTLNNIHIYIYSIFTLYSWSE